MERNKLEKPVKTKKEKIVMMTIDVIATLMLIFIVYKIFSETGFYTASVGGIVLVNLWFKKEMLKVSYFMMRKITKQEQI